MQNDIQDLIDVSRYYGEDKSFVIGGGGNTSVKIGSHIYVKSSGMELASIDNNGFAILDRDFLARIATNEYSNDADVREEQVKSDLLRSRIHPEKNQRPSVETSLHDIIDYKFVVHLHPTLINGIMCSKNAEAAAGKLFPECSIFVKYTDPGYILFKEVKARIDAYTAAHKCSPKLIFLENHGVFVGGDTIDDIRVQYDALIDLIRKNVSTLAPEGELPVREDAVEIIPAIRGALSAEELKVLNIRNSQLVDHFLQSEEMAAKIMSPFTPDGIVYCKPYPLHITNTSSASAIVNDFETKLKEYRHKHGYDPKVVLIKGIGVITVGENNRAAGLMMDVFEDHMKIAFYAQNFGGEQHMEKASVEFIDNWEVEKFRSALSKGSSTGGRLANKIAIVTGGAQGFGKGIVEGMLKEGANVVIADINEEIGHATVAELKSLCTKNSVVFVKTNVTSENDLQQLTFETVKKFGGLDIVVSNAGVLCAGSLTELEEKDFDFVTSVNYKGYYLVTKHCSKAMRAQSKLNKTLMTDIVQINSKSGLQGSNKNFAYAGGKFGGIGLTQSFALELIEYNIKVNSLCPGNFFEGPLWSDPNTGLFAQYLAAGKVPGAKSIEGVRAFYESKVPMKRGCYPEDVLKALYYVVDQQYETGQAIPVTGGQVMIN